MNIQIKGLLKGYKGANMTSNLSFRFLFVLALFAGLMLTACQAESQESSTSPSSDEGLGPPAGQAFSHGHLPLKQMHKEASLIFVGRVVNISPARWNQDSGEYWDDAGTSSTALLLYELEFEVATPIVSTGSNRKHVTITALGPSPLEDNTLQERSDSSHLQVGTEALVFARQTELAFRDGTRLVFMLMGAEATTALIQGADGLYHYPNEPRFSLETLSTIVQSEKTP